MANLEASKISISESSKSAGIVSASATHSPPRVSVSGDQIKAINGPVGILWDIENCPVPSDVRPEDVAGNIRMALRVHPIIRGAVTLFSAFGDFNAFPRRLREGCQRTGVKLVDVPNGRKDAADKAILVDMFLFALDNPPPSSILLISGDVDFAPALHILGQRGYNIILVMPDRVGVSSALSNAGCFVWDWPSVARGEGFIPPKHFIARGSEFTGYMLSSQLGENVDGLNDEEAIVYTGASQGDYNTRSNINQYYYNSYVSKEQSKGFHSMAEYSMSSMSGLPSLFPTRSQSVPSALCEPPLVEQNWDQDQTLWVQPGDIQGLKGQLVRLLETSGGSLPLVRVPSEYLKRYGRPLYVAEYGACKLVNLIRKMGGTLLVVGRGHNKVICLKNSLWKPEKPCTFTPGQAGKERKGNVVMEDNGEISMCPNMGSSSDDLSDDEKGEVVDEERGSNFGEACNHSSRHLESFKKEVQELLVCYSCRILLSSFQSLYEQRYKKPLDYRSFGLGTLEELLEKVNDVVAVHDDPGSNRRFLIWNCMNG